MIYNSLDTIPYKLFLKIEEHNSFWLLNTDIKKEGDCSPENLIKYTEIWQELYNEHLSKNQTTEGKKVFKLSKNINELMALNKVVLMSCETLKFEFDQVVFDILIEKGYKISLENTEQYYADLEKIENEANAYVVKAEHYQNMLPEPKEQTKKEYSVDDVMASYSAIIGIDIGDYNTVTYLKYYAFQKQVNSKINQIKKQNSKSNVK